MDRAATEAGETNDLRVLVCGNFGNPAQVIDGQSIKTRTLRDGLAAALGEASVQTLNTASVFRHPLAFLAEARVRFLECTHLVMLPGPRALRALAELFLNWRGRRSRDLRYVVIGGWLPELLERKPRLRRLCARMDGIYVETRAMRDGLTRLGLDNVKWLPNFRQFDRHMPRLQRTPSVPLRLVFCARVFKEKGIEEAIEAVRLVNGNAASPAVVLDVYGPVEAVYQERFPQVLEGARHVQYKGVLPTESVHSTLQHYDLLLFPTYYSDEGFPGTIVDAYVAGLPVLATDWRYNRELVEHGVTGALYQPQSAVALAVAIGKYVEAPQLIERMRPWCVAEAEHYHVERAVGALIRDFEGRRSDVPAASPGDMRRAV